MAESLFQWLKRERIKCKHCPPREASRQDVFDHIERFCMPVRRQGHNGKKSPVQFEQQVLKTQRSFRKIDSGSTCHDALLRDKRWTNKP